MNKKYRRYLKPGGIFIAGRKENCHLVANAACGRKAKIKFVKKEIYNIIFIYRV